MHKMPQFLVQSALRIIQSGIQKDKTKQDGTKNNKIFRRLCYLLKGFKALQVIDLSTEDIGTKH